MVESIDIEEFIERSKIIPIVDVRSPGEYQQGHISGAINLPLFSDEERKEVGIRYKQSGKDFALLLGLDITGPKLSAYARLIKKIAKDKEVLIHCWRGGKRSESMAWLSDFCGIKSSVLLNGYKSYRKYIRKDFEKTARIMILGGMTGSGKSDILHQMKSDNQQVLDLEEIANHKGSAFGFIGQEKQPTNEQFENDIFNCWNKFDFSKTIWIEDESQSIGYVQIPKPLYHKMRGANVIKIEKNKKFRAKRLVLEYSDCNIDLLESAINKISKRLGGLRTKQCFQALKEKDFEKVALISLDYYDKAYNYGLSKRDQKTIHNLLLEVDDNEKNANEIIKYYQKHF
ncbi:tRNA 2-selenouridine(34) synthase MnmH [Bacteroidota bacterium]